MGLTRFDLPHVFFCKDSSVSAALCSFLDYNIIVYTSFQLLDKPWSQVSSLLPPGYCLQFLSRIGFSNPTARRFSSMLLTHALALSASQFVHKKKSPRIYTRMHSGGLELARLTCSLYHGPNNSWSAFLFLHYTRLEDNLMRHRGDRVYDHVTGTLCYLV